MISIITPCYNGEKFLSRYFKAILSQTFSDIELIFIDDGSTDNTFSIAKSFSSALEEKGIKFILIQEKQNSGVASAVNIGLKFFSRKYLMFLDSDDIIYPNHIEVKIKYMEENNWDFACCKIKIRTEEGKDSGILEIRNRHQEMDVFEKFIKKEGIYFEPIGFVYKSESFLKVNPKREIFKSRAGQNWQIILPMAYNYFLYFIEEFLGEYIIRKDSLSRTENTEEKMKKTNDRREILLNTIDRIEGLTNKEYYINLINKYEPYRKI